jgi:hypothetical protein
MFATPGYVIAHNCPAGLWQISSPSGHVLFESACRDEVEAICVRLNRRLRRRRAHSSRSSRPRVVFSAKPCAAVDFAKVVVAPAFV